jgi:hypothetical protein
MDMRLSKRFQIGERVKVQALFELFNLLNNANPAAVQTVPISNFGQPLQFLPGREGQIGLHVDF